MSFLNQIKKINNQKGSALIMVLVLTIMAGAMSLVFIQRKKMHANIGTRQDIDDGIEKIMATIQSIIISPGNCNANFYASPRKSSTGSLTNIRTCNTGNRRPAGGGGTTIVFRRYASGASWQTQADYANTLGYNGDISGKIRITKLDYRIEPGDDEQTGFYDPAYLTLEVGFEIKQSATSPVKKLSSRTLRFPVVVQDNNSTATTILGCPKAPGTTTLY